MEKKVLLSVQDLVVKFHVRGRVLTAIRGISLDIYENESIAIVGESGSGKSVFTKTFANMLDSNGFIDQGKIIFSDESLANFTVRLGNAQKRMISEVTEKLNEYSKLENGAEIYKQMKCLESEARQKASLSNEERAEIADKLEELRYEHAEAFNLKQTLDSKHDKDKIRQINAQLSDLSKKINELEAMEKATVKQRAAAAKKDHAYQAEYDKKMAQLKEKYAAACATPVTQAQRDRNLELAKEVCLSVNRYGFLDRQKIQRKLMSCLKEAMRQGLDLSRNSVRNDVFSPAIYRVKLLDETPEQLHGRCIFDLANVKYTKDLAQIRGKRIATVFQDPMTSCGCFECICGVEPVSMGVVITCREHAGMTPLGMTFSEMASMTGGGVQTPGFMGHGKHFIASKKFIAAEGGMGRIVWLPKLLKDQMRDRIDATAKELYGVDNFTDMIADETICTEDPEALMNYLTEVGHPVLSMEPFDM